MPIIQDPDSANDSGYENENEKGQEESGSDSERDPSEGGRYEWNDNSCENTAAPDPLERIDSSPLNPTISEQAEYDKALDYEAMLEDEKEINDLKKSIETSQFLERIAVFNFLTEDLGKPSSERTNTPMRSVEMAFSLYESGKSREEMATRVTDLETKIRDRQVRMGNERAKGVRRVPVTP